ncbi:TadE/TadG family type IV pilus assembly protein [Thermotalea metallivorans]|uniref:TadE/TadG family type IV pilus assembly protein n=1 Tax=Thermotalea metallivorans TaxID=520762 RepID=UPI001FA7EC65|nr:TadE family protein [Thermotalea metallivorans]
MKKKLKKIKFWHKEEGQAIIEFTLVLPLLLFIVLASIVFILALYGKIIVIDAAREGARAEALGTTTALLKVQETIENGGLNKDNLAEVNVTRGPTYVSVRVKYNQPSILPGIPRLIGGTAWGDSFPLTGTSLFKIENP